jgi:hypothetical protein
VSDIGEQTARLNTLMRFQQYDQALPFAYGFRLDLLLAQPSSTQSERALENVELAIGEMESLESKYIKAGKFLWSFVVGIPRPKSDAPEPTSQTEDENQSSQERH